MWIWKGRIICLWLLTFGCVELRSAYRNNRILAMRSPFSAATQPEVEQIEVP